MKVIKQRDLNNDLNRLVIWEGIYIKTTEGAIRIITDKHCPDLIDACKSFPYIVDTGNKMLKVTDKNFVSLTIHPINPLQHYNSKLKK